MQVRDMVRGECGFRGVKGGLLYDMIHASIRRLALAQKELCFLSSIQSSQPSECIDAKSRHTWQS